MKKIICTNLSLSSKQIHNIFKNISHKYCYTDLKNALKITKNKENFIIIV